MAIQLTEYTDRDLMALDTLLDNDNPSVLTISKEELVGQVMESFTLGLLSKQSHLTVIASLIKLKVERPDALSFITLQHPQWPIKNPEVRERLRVPWGKDSVQVKKMAEKLGTFKVFLKSINAFNMFCSRRFEAGTWTLKTDEELLKKKKAAAEAAAAAAEALNNNNDNNNNNDGANNNSNINNDVTITPPTNEQIKGLNELQVITMMIDMLNSTELISTDIKELALELMDDLVSEVSPELGEEIKERKADNQ